MISARPSPCQKGIVSAVARLGAVVATKAGHTVSVSTHKTPPGADLLVNPPSAPVSSCHAFAEGLDRAVRLGTEWILAVPERENCILAYMIADMASMSGDQRLHQIVEEFLANPRLPSDNVWRRVLDPTAKVRGPTQQQLARLQDYHRWFVYAIASDEVRMPTSERTALFAPDRFVWGSRTHQLFALLLYRNRVERGPSIDALINHLCEKIAREAKWDIRITDLYLQRIAFLLAAGRPNLVKRRWIERVIVGQAANGGWVSSWHGWGPGLFAFTLRKRSPNAHTTVQGVWILYMLKYRYPMWIEGQCQ